MASVRRGRICDLKASLRSRSSPDAQDRRVYSSRSRRAPSWRVPQLIVLERESRAMLSYSVALPSGERTKPYRRSPPEPCIHSWCPQMLHLKMRWVGLTEEMIATRRVSSLQRLQGGSIRRPFNKDRSPRLPISGAMLSTMPIRVSLITDKLLIKSFAIDCW